MDESIKETPFFDIWYGYRNIGEGRAGEDKKDTNISIPAAGGLSKLLATETEML